MSRSTSRDHYSADDLDRTIEAVLAAASRVSVAPDGYNDPNWNTGNPQQQGNHGGPNNNNNYGHQQQQPHQQQYQNQQPGGNNNNSGYPNQQQQQQQQGSGGRGGPINNNHQITNNYYYYQPPNQQQQNGQPQHTDGFSQVTPRSPLQSGRNNNQPLRPDDDVDAIAEAVLQQRHPGMNQQQQNSHTPSSYYGSQPPSSRQQQQQNNLDGTRNSNWQNNQHQHDNSGSLNNGSMASPNPATASARQQAESNNNKPLSPGELLRKKQRAQNPNRSQEQEVDEDGRPRRTQEENEALRANNEFVIRRMELWQYKKDQDRLKADLERQDRELNGCTFQPDLEEARRGGDMERLMSPSSLYYGNHAWGFDSFVRRLEVARERKIDKEQQDAEAFRVKGAAAAKFRQGNHRSTVPDPFEFASGHGHSSKRLEHHLMTSGRTNVGGSPGGPSLVALRRGQPLHPHQGIRASEVERIAEERSRIRQESGATVPSGAFSQHGAWKDIANPL